MKKQFLILWIALIHVSYSSIAQTSVHTGYLHEKNSSELFQDDSRYAYVGLDFKFRVLNQYLFFGAGLYYNQHLNPEVKSLNYFSGRLRLDFYPFLLSADCDCPEIEKKKESVFNNLFISALTNGYFNTTSHGEYGSLGILRDYVGVGLGIEIPLYADIHLVPQLSYDLWNQDIFISNSDSSRDSSRSRMLRIGLALEF